MGVSENFGNRNILCIREREGGYHVFPSKTFCHTVPKNFVGEHFGVSKNFVYRKIICMRRGYRKTPLKNFCVTVPINFVEHFCVSKEFWYRKFYSKGGGSLTVLSKFFLSLRTEKISPKNHSLFQKLSGREKNLWIRGGASRFSVEKFLPHSTKIFHWGTLWCFRKNLLSKILMHRRGASRFCRNFSSHRTKTGSFVKEFFWFPEKFWFWKKNYG